MKWCRQLVWIAALACAAPAFGAQNRAVQSDQDTLIELERDWNAAFYRKDLPFIQNILADDLVVTHEDGSRGDKAKELALTAAFNQQVDSALQDDFIVKVNGDTAIVWFSLHVVGPSQGVKRELTFRYVDVFVMRGGRWQCVASQSTKVTPQ